METIIYDENFWNTLKVIVGGGGFYIGMRLGCYILDHFNEDNQI